MLQPRTYPELIGKSLVLEAEPFITMVEDDDPWVEGLFLTLCIGLLVGLAQLIGGLLMTATLPPSEAVFETVWRGWQQLGLDAGVDPALIKSNLHQLWNSALFLRGTGGGWARLYIVVLAPLILLLQWLFWGLTTYFVGKWLGGTGTMNQLLGATALIAAPSVLLLFSVVPFVSVSSLLLMVWPLLIIYRAIEVAHDLSWRRSVVVAFAPLILLALLLLLLSMGGGLFLSSGGLG